MSTNALVVVNVFNTVVVVVVVAKEIVVFVGVNAFISLMLSLRCCC